MSDMRIRRKWSFFFYLASVILLVCAPFSLIKFRHLAFPVKTEVEQSENVNENLTSFKRRYSETEIEATELQIYGCEVIHVALVCVSLRSARDVSTLLKSLIYYRKDRLHFHFFSDAVASKILRVLFDTWLVPAVEVTFYPTDQLKNQVDWIQNKHYSGIYGLMKLLLPDQLPSHLDKVIVLDTDVTFAADIGDLWKHFERFDDNQAIGLVENQSPWYLNTRPGSEPWPAVGSGYNTGVMLLDLERLRSLDWNLLWVEIAKKNLKKFASTYLADQDIFNAVIKSDPSLVFRLSCQWNAQLGDHRLGERCHREMTDVKIIHWNSPLKTKTKTKNADLFRHHFLTFLELDGNLLRRNHVARPNAGSPSVPYYDGCDRADVHVERQPQVEKAGKCSDFYRDNLITRRVHLYYIQYSEKLLNFSATSFSSSSSSSPPSSSSISSVSTFPSPSTTSSTPVSFTSNFLRLLDRLTWWRQKADESDQDILKSSDNNNNTDSGAASSSVVESKNNASSYLLSLNRKTTSNKHVGITLVAHLIPDRLNVLERVAEAWPGPMSLSLYASDSEVNRFFQLYQNSDSLVKRNNIGCHVVYREGQYYPISYLRNVALGQVNTRFAFLTDIDFLPAADLYKKVKRHVVSLDLANKKRALVVPAYETKKFKATYPSSKAKLLEKPRDGGLDTFRHRVWPQGQAATDYTKWEGTKEPYEVSWQPNYEPSIVIDRSVPRYDERFLDFGWNKVSHIMEVDAAGYEFWVIPDAFILNLPHSPMMVDLNRYQASELYRHCLKEHKQNFLKHLSRNYGIKALKYLSFNID